MSKRFARLFARPRVEPVEARYLLGSDRLSVDDLRKIRQIGAVTQLIEREFVPTTTTVTGILLLLGMFAVLPASQLLTTVLVLRIAVLVLNHRQARTLLARLNAGESFAGPLTRLTYGVGVAGFLWGALSWPIQLAGPIDSDGFVLAIVSLIAFVLLMNTVAYDRRASRAALTGNALAILPKIALAGPHGASLLLVSYLAMLKILDNHARRTERQSRAMVNLQIRNFRISYRLAKANVKLARALDRAEDLAHLDHLTGLRNRRAFLRDTATLRGGLTSDNCWLLLLDLDHFKVINDHYGHEMGDGVLAAVGRSLGWWETEASERIAARWGGEEFILLVNLRPGIGPETVLEDLRNRIRELGMGMPWPDDFELSASLGSVRLAPDADIAAATGRADEALYEAKRDGRDCWRIAA